MKDLTAPSNLSAQELADWANQQNRPAQELRTLMTAAQIKEWTARMIHDHDTAFMAGKLQIGAGRKVIFSPYQGEVGWLIQHAVRLAFFNQAAYKIACIKPGQECLFPNCQQFEYNWSDQLDDSKRIGTCRLPLDWSALFARHPDAIPIDSGGLSSTQELYPYHLDTHIPIVPLQKQGLKVDVCIGVRNRQFLPAKNYPHWQYIADKLKAAGLTYATIAAKGAGCDLEGQTYLSGDYGWDGAVELLQGCRAFIGTDSGGAHLASLANGCPMIVQAVPDVHSTTTRNFIGRMAETTSHPVIHLPAELWDSPAELLDALWQIVPKGPAAPAPVPTAKKRNNRKRAHK